MAARILTPIEMLERLVAFDTTSRESNLELIGFVRDYLAGYGVESALVFNDEATKANLVATIGPAREGGVALAGHSDVVLRCVLGHEMGWSRMPRQLKVSKATSRGASWQVLREPPGSETTSCTHRHRRNLGNPVVFCGLITAGDRVRGMTEAPVSYKRQRHRPRRGLPGPAPSAPSLTVSRRHGATAR